ncbi:unnamed protein product, partial [Ceratitis capitata]
MKIRTAYKSSVGENETRKANPPIGVSHHGPLNYESIERQFLLVEIFSERFRCVSGTETEFFSKDSKTNGSLKLNKKV